MIHGLCSRHGDCGLMEEVEGKEGLDVTRYGDDWGCGKNVVVGKVSDVWMARCSSKNGCTTSQRDSVCTGRRTK